MHVTFIRCAWLVHHSIMVNVTWLRFDLSTDQVVVGKFDVLRLKCCPFNWDTTFVCRTNCHTWCIIYILSLHIHVDADAVECNGTIDLAFVLHSAGTVHPERWHYVTQFVVDVIEQLDVGLNRTRVAVITWSDSAHVAFTLDRFAARQDVTQVILWWLKFVKRYNNVNYLACCRFTSPTTEESMQENS